MFYMVWWTLLLCEIFMLVNDIALGGAELFRVVRV